jgi:hypothetical protein
MSEDRPGHKLGLKSLAEDILHIRAKYGFRRGAFDLAVEDGAAPDWVLNNIVVLREIEQSVYNEHDFLENFIHALSSCGPIEPGIVENGSMECAR